MGCMLIVAMYKACQIVKVFCDDSALRWEHVITMHGWRTKKRPKLRRLLTSSFPGPTRNRSHPSSSLLVSAVIGRKENDSVCICASLADRSTELYFFDRKLSSSSRAWREESPAWICLRYRSKYSLIRFTMHHIIYVHMPTGSLPSAVVPTLL